MRRLADAAWTVFLGLNRVVCAVLLAATALAVPQQSLAGPGSTLGLPHALGYAG
jgi:hypothetical protein